jgi:His Kinase A (phosphoacceptor) domain.
LHACRSTLEDPPAESLSVSNSVTYSAELIRLSDEIFRLNQEKEELQEQLRFKDRLIAMLAHDLRNPLTAVSIALETLELGSSMREIYAESRLTPETMSQLIKHARTQAKTIDRLITDGYRARIRNHGHSCFLCEIVIRSQFHTTYEPEA